MGLPDRQSICCVSPALLHWPVGVDRLVSHQCDEPNMRGLERRVENLGSGDAHGFPRSDAPYVPGSAARTKAARSELWFAAGTVGLITRARGYGSSAAVDQTMAIITETAWQPKSRSEQELKDFAPTKIAGLPDHVDKD
jgi:hypothetical protein